MDYLAAMRAFVRAVDLGSFSKAATEEGVKTSTISRYVSALESDLGAALLNRSTRQLHVTEAGNTFYERAVQILGDVAEARETTQSLNAHPQGLLRINMPAAFGRRHVVPHLKDFLAAYPDIRVDATLSDATVDLIASGTDVAVRVGALADSTLIARKLAPHRRVLVASAAYLKSAPRLKVPEDIGAHACLEFALQPASAWYVRKPGKGEPRAIAIAGPLRVNDSEALREAALSGLGLALLPSWIVGEDIRDGRLVEVLGEWEWLIAPGPERAIWGIYPPKKVVPPKVRAFLDFLAHRFGQPPYWDRPQTGRLPQSRTGRASARLRR